MVWLLRPPGILLAPKAGQSPRCARDKTTVPCMERLATLHIQSYCLALQKEGGMAGWIDRWTELQQMGAVRARLAVTRSLDVMAPVTRHRAFANTRCVVHQPHDEDTKSRLEDFSHVALACFCDPGPAVAGRWTRCI